MSVNDIPKVAIVSPISNVLAYQTTAQVSQTKWNTKTSILSETSTQLTSAETSKENKMLVKSFSKMPFRVNGK